MRILISGSTGLIGSRLVTALTEGGHEVVRLVRFRRPVSTTEIVWDPTSSHPISGLEGLDAVIHLAGENLAGRWTYDKKTHIGDSRVNGTHLLAESVAALPIPPKVMICASAVGYYGDRGDEFLLETSPPGRGFLAEVCEGWEAAAQPAAHKGIRVVHTRFGIVLSMAGGALAQMLHPFRMGLGGVVGSGRQYWSWVTLDDTVRVILHILNTENLSGPVNVTTPNPSTCREFVKTLGHILGRPTVFHVPALAARLALGEMADALVLSSARVVPEKLLASGFTFNFPDLEPALKHVLWE